MENLIPPTTKPPRTKTMTPAALAANRANAQKSTGPRTPEGKARSASNNFRHGLYRLEAYSQFATSHDLALATAHNYLEQLNPVTPLEHTYVHSIVALELRHLQLETLYNQTLTNMVNGQEPRYLPALLQQLSATPTRLEKAVKAYRAEVAARLAQVESTGDAPIPIEDFPALPMPAEPPTESPAQTPAPAPPPPNPTSSYINTFLHHLSLNYGRSSTPEPVTLPTEKPIFASLFEHEPEPEQVPEPTDAPPTDA